MRSFLLNVFLIAFGTGLVAQPLRASGNEGGHAGDYLATEFIVHGQKLLRLLQKPVNQNILDQATYQRLIKVVRDTPVNSTKDILRDPRNGNAVDAMTFADTTSASGFTILLQEARWEKLLNSKVNVYRLVFHEYLWSLGLDDENNRISGYLEPDDTNLDGVAGTSWTVSDNKNGLNGTRSISFDLHGGYRVLETFTDASAYGTRGMQSFGTYNLAGSQIILSRLGSSCPLSNAELGRIDSTLSFTNNQLSVESINGGLSVYFTRLPDSGIALNGVINWGCLSRGYTFVPYSGLTATAQPVAALANTYSTPRPNELFQAIAFSYSHMKNGQSWNYPNAGGAILAAIANCGYADCEAIGWSGNGCLSFAVSDAARHGWYAYDVNRDNAEALSLRDCNAHYTNSCRIDASVCPYTGQRPNSEPALPPTVITSPTVDVATPFVVTDTGSVLTYNIYFTDQVGNWGNVALTGETGTRTFYLNPSRRATFTIVGGVTHFCFDPRLKSSIQMNVTGAVISYCSL